MVVAENDDDDIVLLRDIFAEAGMFALPHFVRDGRELIDYLEQNRSCLPDAVLINVEMPKMDGLEALEEIRSDPELRKVPVIVISGTREYLAMLVRRHPGVGIDPVIIKPVTAEALLEALEPFGCCLEESGNAMVESCEASCAL